MNHEEAMGVAIDAKDKLDEALAEYLDSGLIKVIVAAASEHDGPSSIPSVGIYLTAYKKDVEPEVTKMRDVVTKSLSANLYVEFFDPIIMV